MNDNLKDSKGRYVVRVPKPRWFLHRGVDTIPGYVWRNSKYTLQPRDFALEHPRLEKKIISGSMQIKSLESFLHNPLYPGVYGVASEPTDSYALYFAGYLAYLYTTYKNSLSDADAVNLGDVRWNSLQGGYKNPLIHEDGSTNPDIGMLILSGVTPDSTQHKLEKLRDTLIAYSHIPRVVVIAGEDPITFFSTRIHHKMTQMYFHSGAIVKRAVEVI